MQSDAAMGADPERQVRIGSAVNDHVLRPVEDGRIEVGAQPAHYDEIAAPDQLSSQLRVLRAGPAQGLIDRGPTQVLLACRDEKVEVVDQALAELWVAGKVAKSEGRERCGRIES